jgi:hypothetical protein
MSRARAVATFVIFLALAVAHTWPLASAPARLSRNDNADALLNEWILAWVAHEAPRNPLHLFDANIFYPDRNTLAYSEPLITTAALGAPLFWAGAPPVLVHNLLLIVGLALTGWATCLLLVRWTGDLAAGLFAGTVAAFNAHTFTRMPQIQAHHLEFLPLALVSLDALLEHPRPRYAAALAAALVLAGMNSFYIFMLTIVALGAGWIVRAPEWTGVRARAVWPQLGLAAAIASAALLPIYLPYTRLGQVRTLEEVALFSATWRQYLSTPARIHFGWSAPFEGPSLFPGVIAVVLTMVCVARGTAIEDRRARMAVAFGIAGVALSLGPFLPGYGLLYKLFVPLQGIRNASRFGYLAIFATAILGGYGLAGLRWRRTASKPIAAVALLIVAGANLDAWCAPLGFTEVEHVSPLHARLLGTDAIVAEMPFYSADRVFHNADYLLHSTRHWRPMVNGYSGLTPTSYEQHAVDLRRFPDPHAIETLRAIGVTHVFVHDRLMREWYDNETADAVRHAPGLRLVAFDGDVALYEIVRTAAGPS